MDNDPTVSEIIANQRKEIINRQSQEIQEGVVGLLNKTRKDKVSSVFFLDKSARPVAWMYRQVWKGLVGKGLIPKDEPMPALRFINIGRDQEDNVFDPDSTAMIEAKKKYKISPSGTIMIVDEFKEHGTTLARAEKIVSQLFPKRDIATHVAFRNVPPWQNSGELIGIEEKELNNEGNVKKGERVWVYPLSGYETISGIKPADNKRNIEFRRLLKSEIVDHIVSESVRLGDGGIMLPNLNVGFRAEG